VNKDHEPYPYRRHLTSCRFFGPGGREVRLDLCNCPFHVEGKYCGLRLRGSLKTRSHQTAQRNLRDLIAKVSEKCRIQDNGKQATGNVSVSERTVAEAVERFLASKGEFDKDGTYRGDVEQSTHRKYSTGLNFLECFCQERNIIPLKSVGVDILEDYRRTLRVQSGTWKVERQTLITFFGYCVRRKWISSNPARDLDAPRNLKPNDVVPYTPAEEEKILEACQQIGGGKDHRSGAVYEQLRARAMVMLLRHTAFEFPMCAPSDETGLPGILTLAAGAFFCAPKRRARLCISPFRRSLS
jgi:hypothetical protein